VKVSFRTGVDRDTFGGALLYHLQRKEKGESEDQSDIDTSTSTQFFVIWGSIPDVRSYPGVHVSESYLRAYLIEHESALTWNEDKLKRLYHVYNDQFTVYNTISLGCWLLNDNTKLDLRN
jgi:hypothetical protein